MDNFPDKKWQLFWHGAELCIYLIVCFYVLNFSFQSLALSNYVDFDQLWWLTTSLILASEFEEGAERYIHVCVCMYVSD